MYAAISKYHADQEVSRHKLIVYCCAYEWHKAKDLARNETITHQDHTSRTAGRALHVFDLNFLSTPSMVFCVLRVGNIHRATSFLQDVVSLDAKRRHLRRSIR